MTLDMLEHLLGIILSRETICGIDICGECQPDLPLPEYMEAEEKNERINHELRTSSDRIFLLISHPLLIVDAAYGFTA